VLVFDVVVDRSAALVAGAVVAAILAGLLVALPLKLVGPAD
jgi:hypothetical protein